MPDDRDPAGADDGTRPVPPVGGEPDPAADPGPRLRRGRVAAFRGRATSLRRRATPAVLTAGAVGLLVGALAGGLLVAPAVAGPDGPDRAAFADRFPGRGGPDGDRDGPGRSGAQERHGHAGPDGPGGGWTHRHGPGDGRMHRHDRGPGERPGGVPAPAPAAPAPAPAPAPPRAPDAVPTPPTPAAPPGPSAPVPPTAAPAPGRPGT